MALPLRRNPLRHQIVEIGFRQPLNFEVAEFIA
jgi:hypothetical protein